ncbi:MAG: hypothetical protein AAF740_10080, partial [Bacteroidota bacterium]
INEAMKTYLLIFAASLLLWSCDSKPTEPEENIEIEEAPNTEELVQSEDEVIPTAEGEDNPILDKMGNWKALEVFHREIGMTYHPAVDDDNLEPIKTYYMELTKAAQSLASATPPPAFDNEATQEKIYTLVVKTQDLANLMEQNPTDEQIKAALTELHDVYHHLEEIKHQGAN